MKKLLLAAAAAAAAFAAAPAMAQDAADPQVYGSLGYANISDDFLSLGAVQARVGVRLHQYFGIEGEAAVGITDDEFFGVDVDLDHQFAAYGVIFLPAGEQFDLIGRIGYSTFQVSAGGGSADVETVNYGVGGQWNIDEHNSVRGDYTYMDGDGDAQMWSIAYVRRF